MKKTRLDINILETFDCKTLAFVDASEYNANMVITDRILQIQVPGYTKIVETAYKKEGVTILNSNSLNLTSTYHELQELPDGFYVLKISICPHEVYFCEKTLYRTCALDCKYEKAVLMLDINTCTDCVDRSKLRKIDEAKRYIEGVVANANAGNIDKANSLYQYVDKLLEDIINCDCEKNCK